MDGCQNCMESCMEELMMPNGFFGLKKIIQIKQPGSINYFHMQYCVTITQNPFTHHIKTVKKEQQITDKQAAGAHHFESQFAIISSVYMTVTNMEYVGSTQSIFYIHDTPRHTHTHYNNSLVQQQCQNKKLCLLRNVIKYNQQFLSVHLATLPTIFGRY